MDALYQRLKELSPETFEQFTLHLLKERHPNITIHHVDGKGGDEGVDHFAGELAEGPTVWQVKAFPAGIKAKQKDQISNSLARVIGTCNPKLWILCTNIDLDIKTHKWFQKLQRRHDRTIRLGLLQASQIVHELLHRRTLRDHYFPGAALDTNALRALVTRTGELTNDELQTLTEENAHQYLQRLKDRDARFTYEITFADDRAPSTSNSSDAIFELSNGNTVIRAYPRDHDALEQAPPKMHFDIAPGAYRKIQDFLETGRAQHLDPGEIIALTTDLPIHDELFSSVRELTLQLGPTTTREPLPLRLTCGSGARAVTYEYVLFRITRIGNKEAELTSTAQLPFTTTIIIGEDHQGSINFKEHAIGVDVCEVRKFIDAMHAIHDTSYVETYDLQNAKMFFRGRMSNIHLPEHWAQGFEPFIRDLAAIAETFHAQLSVPSGLSEQDQEAFITLKAVVEGTAISLDNVTFVITKSVDNTASIMATLERGACDIRYEMPEFDVTLFQTPVKVGPVTVHILTAPIKDALACRDQWQKVAEGEDVKISLGPAEATISRNMKK